MPERVGRYMKYKLFVTDMDGTLLNSNKEITRENKTAINRLIENGIDVVLASGRHPALLKEFPRKLGLKTPVIGCNGGVIKDLGTEKILYMSEMKMESVIEAIEIANKYNIDFWIYEKDNIFYNRETDRVNKHLENNKTASKDEIVPMMKFNSISDLTEGSRKIIKVLFILIGHEDAKEKLFCELTRIPDIEFCQSDSVLIDVMNKGISKGSAVKLYAEKKGIRSEEIIAIGDNDNDTSMIEYAGLGIAMGNAEEDIKKASQYVTKDCDSNGFGDVVDKILNGEL